ncbi:MAG: FCD domain-containing protein [Limnochordia bacterium]|nr:FCD domain-containing protein [Limnochordia bacterium]MDD4518963.1 FCD domain-containing protein [Limnochordia bacterium]
MELGEIRYRTASEQVEDEIKRYVLRNNLQPGDTMPTETEMAEMLGTSRTTVREALRVLQFLGVIKTKQRLGAMISDTDPSVLEDYFVFSLQFGDPTNEELMEARRIIETNVLPLVIERATENDFALMEQIVKEGERGLLNARLQIHNDCEFHNSLIAATKNRALTVFTEVLQKFFETMWLSLDSGDTVKDSDRVNNEHWLLIEALRCKDLEKATQVLLKHLQAYENMLQDCKR